MFLAYFGLLRSVPETNLFKAILRSAAFYWKQCCGLTRVKFGISLVTEQTHQRWSTTFICTLKIRVYLKQICKVYQFLFHKKVTSLNVSPFDSLLDWSVTFLPCQDHTFVRVTMFNIPGVVTQDRGNIWINIGLFIEIYFISFHWHCLTALK